MSLDDVHPSDDRLAADDLSGEEREHLATCPACRARVAAARPGEATWGSGGDDTVSVPGDPALVSDAPIRVAPARRGAEVGREHAGRYVRLAEIGAGGMGRVDLVDDGHLGRRVALKEHSARDGGQRFVREARITAQLEHPGVVPVYDFGARADGRLYYTMRHVRGRTLAQALGERHTLDERLGLLGAFEVVCQTLGYAHGKGVVHRDLKPDNVMIGSHGEAVVLDWGLARADGDAEPPAAAAPDASIEIRSGGASLTRAGTVMGTVPYMAPEQAAGGADRCDARSDVWSLGVILYEILTGVRAFDGADAVEVLLRVQQLRFVPVAARCPEAPPELVAIVDKAMSADPGRRYPTAHELAQDVEAWRNGGRVGAYSYTRGQLVRRTVWRYRLVVGALGVAVAAAAIVVPTLLVQRDRAWAARREALLARDEALAAEHASFVRALRALSSSAEAEGHTNEALALARAALAEATGGLAPESVREGTIHALGLGHRAGARVLTGPSGAVDALAFSPDGTRLLSLHQGRAVVWTLADGAASAEVEVAEATRIAWAGTSERFAAFGPEGPDCVFDGWTSARLYCLGVPAVALRWSPDGSRLAAVGPEGIVVVDGASGAQVAAAKVPAGTLAWSPDGRTLATAADDLWSRAIVEVLPADSSVRQWSAEDLAPLRRVATPSPVGRVAFSSDGAQLLAERRVLTLERSWGDESPERRAGSPGVDCYDVATGAAARCVDGLDRASLLDDWSPFAQVPTGRWWPRRPTPGAARRADGTELFATDDALHLVAGGELVATWDVSGVLHAGVIATTRGRNALGSRDGHVRLFDDPPPRTRFASDDPGLRWYQAGPTRLVSSAGTFADEVRILDTATSSVSAVPFPQGRAHWSVRWQGARLLGQSLDQWWVFDPLGHDSATWSEDWPELDLGANVARFSIAFDRDTHAPMPSWGVTVGGSAACVSVFPRLASQDRLVVRSLADGAPLHRVHFDGPRSDAAALADCVRVVSIAADGRIELRPVADGADPLWTRDGGDRRRIEPAPSAAHVVLCDDDPEGSCDLVDSATGAVLAWLPGTPTFSPDGTWSATRSAGAVEVRDRSGATVRTWSFPYEIRSLQLTDDGWLIVHVFDGYGDLEEVRVVDVATGAVRLVQVEEAGSVWAVAHDPDARAVALVHRSGVTSRHRLDVPPAEDTIARTGAATNLRVCRDALRVVPVTPWPSPESVWAPETACAPAHPTTVRTEEPQREPTR